jgi:hypothetical protein
MPYDNDGSGVLFKNKKKDTETKPDYTGSIEIDGKDYWLSAWINVGKPTSRIPGETFMSLKANIKEPHVPTSPVRDTTDVDDDIPF